MNLNCINQYQQTTLRFTRHLNEGGIIKYKAVSSCVDRQRVTLAHFLVPKVNSAHQQRTYQMMMQVSPDQDDDFLMKSFIDQMQKRHRQPQPLQSSNTDNILANLNSPTNRSKPPKSFASTIENPHSTIRKLQPYCQIQGKKAGRASLGSKQQNNNPTQGDNLTPSYNLFLSTQSTDSSQMILNSQCLACMCPSTSKPVKLAAFIGPKGSGKSFLVDMIMSMFVGNWKRQASRGAFINQPSGLRPYVGLCLPTLTRQTYNTYQNNTPQPNNDQGLSECPTILLDSVGAEQCSVICIVCSVIFINVDLQHLNAFEDWLGTIGSINGVDDHQNGMGRPHFVLVRRNFVKQIHNRQEFVAQFTRIKTKISQKFGDITQTIDMVKLRGKSEVTQMNNTSIFNLF